MLAISQGVIRVEFAGRGGLEVGAGVARGVLKALLLSGMPGARVVGGEVG